MTVRLQRDGHPVAGAVASTEAWLNGQPVPARAVRIGRLRSRAVVLALDCSGSMARPAGPGLESKSAYARRACTSFVTSLNQPGQAPGRTRTQVALLLFGGQPTASGPAPPSPAPAGGPAVALSSLASVTDGDGVRRLLPPGSGIWKTPLVVNPGAVLGLLATVSEPDPSATTPPLAAAVSAADLLAAPDARAQRKLIVLFTDGFDNPGTPGITAELAVQRARQAEASIYTVGWGAYSVSPGMDEAQLTQAVDEGALGFLAAQTGGASFLHRRSPEELADLFGKVAAYICGEMPVTVEGSLPESGRLNVRLALRVGAEQATATCTPTLVGVWPGGLQASHPQDVLVAWPLLIPAALLALAAITLPAARLAGLRAEVARHLAIYPPPASPSADPRQPQRIGQDTCPYDGYPFGDGETVFLCPQCGLAMHVDCFHAHRDGTLYRCLKGCSFCAERCCGACSGSWAP